MAESRTLKLSILADVDQLKKSLKSAENDVDNSSSKLSEFGKKAGLAFAAAGAAAGAYAIKLAVDGVKAAIEDEAAQVRLANALKAATGATEAQIKATENQITKMALATGVGDDQLRPALQRIALSTGDLSKAQDLLAVAMDTATATGKPLETVANAIGRAYDGNAASLGKLGIGLSTAELKTMSFTQVQQKLTDLFGGAAAQHADTYAGRMERLKVTFDEAKETIGYKLLPIIQKLVDFVVNDVVPSLGKFADFFKPITDAVERNKETFMTFITFIQKYVVPVLVTVLGGAFKVVGEIAGGIINVIGFVINGLNTLISGAVAGINMLIRAYNSIPFLPNVSQISAPTISVPKTSMPNVGSTTTLPIITVPTGSTSTSSGSGGGVSTAAKTALTVADAFAGLGVTGGGNVNSSDYAQRNAGVVNNITVNGAVDAESTARQIVGILNDSFYRGSGGATSLQMA